MNRKTRRVALDGLLFALAIVLSIVEGMLPVPMPAPGVKMGLSNIAVMYALFFVGWKDALVLAALKGGFAFITRGAVAGMLSLMGGILSVLIMAGVNMLFKGDASYFLLSVAGALAHNAGQMLAVMTIYPSVSMLAFAPILMVSGVAAGFVTSLALRAFLPAMRRLGLTDP